MTGAHRTADGLRARAGDTHATGRPATGAEHRRPVTGRQAVLALQRAAGNAAVVEALRTPARLDLQRDPEPRPARQDVVYLLSPDENLLSEVRVIAPGAKVLRVLSLADMVKQTKRLTFPVGTVYFVGHSLSSGDIGFESATEVKYVLPEAIATALRDALPASRKPENIDFRGCSVGQSPSGMEAIRTALGAGKATASTCFLVTVSHGPIKLDGKEITRAAQVTAKNRAEFQQGFKMLLDAFGKTRKCILNNSEKGYFAAGGKLVAVWANPELDTEWDSRGSVCYADLPTEKVDPKKRPTIDPQIGEQCKLITVEGKP